MQAGEKAAHVVHAIVRKRAANAGVKPATKARHGSG